MRVFKKGFTLFVGFGALLLLSYIMAQFAKDSIPYTLVVPFHDSGILSAWIAVNLNCYLGTGLIVYICMIIGFFYCDSNNKKHRKRPNKLIYIIIFTVIEYVLIFITIGLFILLNTYSPEIIYIQHLKYLCFLPVLSLIFHLVCFVLPSKNFCGWMK